MQSDLLLALLDVGVLAAGAAGLVALAALKPRRVDNLPEAFKILERTISVSLPWIPAGRTWGETFAQLKEARVKADWAKIDAALHEYESYRYGGRPAPTEGRDDVVGLAHTIQKGVNGNGPKGKGARTG